MKNIIAIAAIILMAMSAQAQQYKFSKCDNYHFMLDYGYTVNEVIMYGGKGGLIVVDITNDSIKFNTPILSISDKVAFKIEKREEQVDVNGNKLIMITVGVVESHTVVSIVLAGKELYTSFEL